MTAAAKPILIIQNNHRPHTGLIEGVLRSHTLPFVVVAPFQTGELPLTLHGYSAVVMMGGPASANDQTMIMQHLISLTQQAVEEAIPYLGICLGHQVLAKATGGKVQPLARRSIGLQRVQLNAMGQSETLFQGMPASMDLLHRNGEIAVQLGQGEVLANGDDGDIQSFRIGDQAYGVQFHPELTADLYQLWLEEETAMQKLPPLEFNKHVSLGTTLLNNWIRLFYS